MTPAERILATADKLFYAQGIRAVGVDTIAEQAGVSKRTLYNHYPSKDALIAAYLTTRFKQIAPSDAPAREQILGTFDRLERMFRASGFRGCPFVNAVAEMGNPKHAACRIAAEFKEQRRQWFRNLLLRIGVRNPDSLSVQLQILVDGAIATALVRNDPAIARFARDAAATLLDAAVRGRTAGRSAPGRIPSVRT